jgi:hypothetical protein
MSKNHRTHSDETYQEGVTPVQSFTSPAIPVTSEAALIPRLGRPRRQIPATPPDTTNMGQTELPGTVAGLTEQLLPEESD